MEYYSFIFIFLSVTFLHFPVWASGTSGGSSGGSRGGMKAGVSRVEITPSFEGRKSEPAQRHYLPFDGWEDTGVDLLYDFEEMGAFGPDQQPGQAHVDDDGNGIIDDCSRQHCDEYLSRSSDDRRDPNEDNFHLITNPLGTEKNLRFEKIALGGYQPLYPIVVPNRLASGVHDPIWSRAVAIEDERGEKIILISTDLPGLSWKYINPVKRQIARDLGIPFENVIIASTHDHAAPDGSGYWISVRPSMNDDWMAWVKQQIFLSAKRAVEDLQLAEMRVTTTRHIACQDAQTRELKKDPHCHYPQSVLDRRPERDRWILQKDKRDPIVPNNSITVVHFRALKDQSTIATLVNWHNHPEAMGDKNFMMTSDYPHYLRHYVETKLGGTAVYFTGTLGNQIGTAPSPYWDENMNRVMSAEQDELGNFLPVFIDEKSWANIRSIGYEIGHEVVTALSQPLPVTRNLQLLVQVKTVDVVISSALHNIGSKTAFLHDVEAPDRMHRRGRNCWRSIVGCARHHVSLITLNSELSFASLPGEIDPAYYFGRAQEQVIDYGKKGKHRYPPMPALKDALPGRHHFIVGQGNGYLSYLVPESDNIGWSNFGHPNHYEEFVTVGRTFGDQAANALMELTGSPLRFGQAEGQFEGAADYEHFHRLNPVKWMSEMNKELARPEDKSGE